MRRLAPLSPAEMDAEQRALLDRMTAGPRGASAASGGPFAVWLHSPPFGSVVERFGAHVRYGTTLPPRTSELAILVCARFWRAEYEWFVHAPIAAAAGVPAALIEAIRSDAPCRFENAHDEAVVLFAREALDTRAVSQATYDRLVALLGVPAVVELVGVLGYYCLVSLTLNVFEVESPTQAFSREGGTDSQT